MKVNIVCYEDPDRWVLGKFARKLEEHLCQAGVDAVLARVPDEGADINHHIIYLGYDGRQQGVDTLMVTHIDTAGKLLQLKRQMQNAALAVCMSSSTVQQLITAGVPAEKLCYVLPAQNEAIKPRKISVGVTTRVYQDGRKRQELLLKLAEKISPVQFRFKIMGEGWDTIVDELRNRKFEVDYFSDFAQDDYVGLIQSLDYYLYPGEDEGAMGVVDALAAGVPVISTPQGYHLDVPGGLPYLFRSEAELIEIFMQISANSNKLMNAVADWTWEDYARKHLQLWEHLLGSHTTRFPGYRDGLASLGRLDGVDVSMRSRAVGVSTVAQGSLRNWWGRLKSCFRPGGVKY